MRPRPPEGTAQADAGLKTHRTANVVIRGHAFIQNLRRGHYELAVDATRVLRLAHRIRRTQTRHLISTGPDPASAWPAIEQRNRAHPGHHRHAVHDVLAAHAGLARRPLFGRGPVVAADEDAAAGQRDQAVVPISVKMRDEPSRDDVGSPAPLDREQQPVTGGP
jgi:hypothetical protein